MPSWIVRVCLFVGAAGALTLVLAALLTGDWGLLSPAAAGLLGVAVLALLVRRPSGPPAASRGRRLPRTLAAGGCVFAALASALVYDWRLDSVWTPVAVLGVVWLGMLAIALSVRLPRDPE